MTARYKYDESEREINAVLNAQDDQLRSLETLDTSLIEGRISQSESLLSKLGYDLPRKPSYAEEPNRAAAHAIPTWEEVYQRSLQATGAERTLEGLFTEDEIRENSLAIARLNEDFNQVHRLDGVDIAICAGAGLLAGALDVLLVGIPEPTKNGLEAGPMSDAVRQYFDKAFPEDEMKMLAGKRCCKVPYDAQDNRHTTVAVEGLSTYYHRLYSLGHDPLLGLFIGVKDIMSGTMTTIDKNGNIAVQALGCYADRRETDVFEAIAKQIRHYASDVTTPMGLPAPLAGLFNLAQFGSVGEYEQTVAEIAQGMYAQGYDFIHFCSMSIPVAVAEVVVRVGYALKRISEGHSIRDSIPVTTSRAKHPKLGTMLFVAHSAATAINAGKVYVNQGNPMAINYPQWIAFAKYSFQQAKWALLDKPELRHAHVTGEIDAESELVYAAIDASFERLTDGAIVMGSWRAFRTAGL